MSDCCKDHPKEARQKAAMLAKKDELKAKREEFKNLSPEERRTQIKATHEEFRVRLKDEGKIWE